MIYATPRTERVATVERLAAADEARWQRVWERWQAELEPLRAVDQRERESRNRDEIAFVDPRDRDLVACQAGHKICAGVPQVPGVGEGERQAHRT